MRKPIFSSNGDETLMDYMRVVDAFQSRALLNPECMLTLDDTDSTDSLFGGFASDEKDVDTNSATQDEFSLDAMKPPSESSAAGSPSYGPVRRSLRLLGRRDNPRYVYPDRDKFGKKRSSHRKKPSAHKKKSNRRCASEYRKRIKQEDEARSENFLCLRRQLKALYRSCSMNEKANKVEKRYTWESNYPRSIAELLSPSSNLVSRIEGGELDWLLADDGAKSFRKKGPNIKEDVLNRLGTNSEPIKNFGFLGGLVSNRLLSRFSRRRAAADKEHLEKQIVDLKAEIARVKAQYANSYPVSENSQSLFSGASSSADVQVSLSPSPSAVL